MLLHQRKSLLASYVRCLLIRLYCLPVNLLLSFVLLKPPVLTVFPMRNVFCNNLFHFVEFIDILCCKLSTFNPCQFMSNKFTSLFSYLVTWIFFTSSIFICRISKKIWTVQFWTVKIDQCSFVYLLIICYDLFQSFQLLQRY